MRAIQIRGVRRTAGTSTPWLPLGSTRPREWPPKRRDRSFDLTTNLRALQFHGDGTQYRAPLALQGDLTRCAQTVDSGKQPSLHARRGLSPGGRKR
jgi:hypothetical protein